MYLHCYNKSLHDVNAIKIAGSDIITRLRYHTEDTLMYIIVQIFTFLFQSSNHSVLLGRSRHEEIANLSEDEDGKEGVAKATEDGTALPIILKAENRMYACIRSGNKTFAQLVCPLHDNRMNKNR